MDSLISRLTIIPFDFYQVDDKFISKFEFLTNGNYYFVQIITAILPQISTILWTPFTREQYCILNLGCFKKEEDFRGKTRGVRRQVSTTV